MKRHLSGVSLLGMVSDEESNSIKVIRPIVFDIVDIEGIRNSLEQEGYAVVGSILNEDEMIEFETNFWNALNNRQPSLVRKDMSSWTPQNVEWIGTAGEGQYKHYGMAQEAHCWQIRMHRGIRSIFESLYEEECCVSLDGGAAIFSAYKSSLELRVDVARGSKDDVFNSIQAAYNLYEVKVDRDRYNLKAGAGFVCVPGSHGSRYNELFPPETGNGRRHWKVTDKSLSLQPETVLIASPENCLILWNSRLTYRNYGGDFSPQELCRPCRLTQYVCWQPKRLRTQKAFLKKVQTVLKGKCGSHWATLGVTEPLSPFPGWRPTSIPVINPFEGLIELSEDILSIL
jgi:hypothetical protein